VSTSPQQSSSRSVTSHSRVGLIRVWRVQEFCLRTQGMTCNCLRCAHDTQQVYGRPVTPGAGPRGRFTPTPMPKDNFGEEAEAAAAKEGMTAAQKANQVGKVYENRVLPNQSKRF
jgi:hypothetical protein